MSLWREPMRPGGDVGHRSVEVFRPVGLVDQGVEDPDQIRERDGEVASEGGIAGEEAGAGTGMEGVAPGVPDVDEVGPGVEPEDGVEVAWRDPRGRLRRRGLAAGQAAPGEVGGEEGAGEGEEALDTAGARP